MAKVGRPKLPAGEAKETRFELRLTAEDKEQLEYALDTGKLDKAIEQIVREETEP